MIRHYSFWEAVVVLMHFLKMPGSSTWVHHHGGGNSFRLKMRTMVPLNFGVTLLVRWASVWWFSHRLHLAVHHLVQVLILGHLP